MSFNKELRQDILQSGRESRGPLLEKRWEHPCDFLHGNATGKLTSLCPTHAVANCKDKVGSNTVGFTDFPKMSDFMRIDREPKEGILIVLTDAPTVCMPRPGDQGDGLLRRGGPVFS